MGFRCRERFGVGPSAGIRSGRDLSPEDEAMLRVARALLVLWTLALPSSSLAFDGQREGFVLGGGLGAGLVSFEQEISGGGLTVSTERQEEGALATGFVIGAGLNETTVLAYSARVSWFSIVNLRGDDVTVTHALGTVALTQYRRPVAPSFYYSMGVGFSTWDLPFEEDSGDPWIGLGLRGGVGYEFHSHFAVELSLGWGEPSTEEGGFDVSSNAISVNVVLVGLAY